MPRRQQRNSARGFLEVPQPRPVPLVGYIPALAPANNTLQVKAITSASTDAVNKYAAAQLSGPGNDAGCDQ
jgi:hypothetical protein